MNNKEKKIKNHCSNQSLDGWKVHHNFLIETVCSHLCVIYLHSGCQINNHSNVDSTVCVNDFIVKVLEAYIYNGDKYSPIKQYPTVKTFFITASL